ncbi:MAG: ParB/RepB/Spo0J family partition protein [Anaerolineales bacterium]|nr:ParB/RepB/Spo0J family partition protein [Anaerolineales bacterium]
MMHIQPLPLELIRLDARNPRTDGEGSVNDLAASLKGAGLVQPPIVVPDGDGGYRVLVGERRVRAARQAGLSEIACLISEPLDPVAAHRARVAENLHRRELNPIDHALALRVSWLLANACAMNLEAQAAALMAAERPLSAIRADLETLLNNSGFHPQSPAVTWETVLDELGIEMQKARRKKLLRVLSIPPDVQEKLRQLPVSEAGARALGTLDENSLRQVTEAIEENPDLARRARRIARAVRDQGYSPQEAIAEASGQFLPTPAQTEPKPPDENAAAAFADDQAVIDAVMAWLDAANVFQAALQQLRRLAPQTLDIPDPWRNFYLSTLNTIREEIES